jgi:outer membrane protein assembly factor BamD
MKFEKAVEYYQKKDYQRALTLLEGLLPIIKGTDKAEKGNYLYAYCYYETGDYILAGYYFGAFVKTFPRSQYIEEAEYKAAYCYYLDSPRYTLDQENTYKAIEAFQQFISKYPKTDRKQECENYITELRNKIEKKSFAASKLYFDMGNYKSAVISLKNTLKEFPDTEYREEILYLIVKASFLYAKNSIISKQEERFKDTMKECYPLLEEFPKSKYLKDTDHYKQYSEKKIEEIKKLHLAEKI